MTSNNNNPKSGHWIGSICQQGLCEIINCNDHNMTKSFKSIEPKPLVLNKWGQPMLQDNINDRGEMICKLIAKLSRYL